MPRFSVTFILALCFPLFNYHNFCFININIKLHVFDTLNGRYITCIILNNQGMKEQTDWLVLLDLKLELEQRPVYATGQGTALLALRAFPCVVSQWRQYCSCSASVSCTRNIGVFWICSRFLRSALSSPILGTGCYGRPPPLPCVSIVIFSWDHLKAACPSEARLSWLS